MFSVALIGPDGAGKTTVARRLEQSLPFPAKYLYMGMNADASNVALPTTRLLRLLRQRTGTALDQGGPRDASRQQPRPRGLVRRTLSGFKSGLGMLNRTAEEWFRQRTALRHQRGGCVVLFDRHFFADYYAYDIAAAGPRPLHSRIHGFLLQRVLAKPDLVVYLDAPAELLFARKGEGSVVLLEQRRQDYLAMQSLVPHFAVVDASQPLESVIRDVTECIEDFYRAQPQGSGGAHHVRS